MCNVNYLNQTHIQLKHVFSDNPFTGWSGDVSITAGSGAATVATPVVEGSATGTTLFIATANGGTGTVTYAFTADGNPNSVADSTIISGTVRLAGLLDYAIVDSYIFKIV